MKGANSILLEDDEDKVDHSLWEVASACMETRRVQSDFLHEELFPMSRGQVEERVHAVLGSMKNVVAPGNDWVGYYLIKVVRDPRLIVEQLEEIVDNLLSGVIPYHEREIRVIFIPKPSFDLSVTKNWRALNLITYVGKVLGKMIDY